MNSIDKVLQAYYNYCKAIKQKYQENYPDFEVIELSLGISLLSKN